MHNCSHQGLSKNWKTCTLSSGSVLRLRKGMFDWEVVLLWVFVYTGRRIEDIQFESSGYHVCWLIIVFCFGHLPTLLLSAVWSHLENFYFHLIIFFVFPLTLYLVVFLSTEPLQWKDCCEQRSHIQACRLRLNRERLFKGTGHVFWAPGGAGREGQGLSGLFAILFEIWHTFTNGRIAGLVFLKTDKWERVLSGF